MTILTSQGIRLSYGNGSAKHSSTATAYSESLANSIDVTNANYFLICAIL